MIKSGSIAVGFAVLLGGSGRAQVTERVTVDSAGLQSNGGSFYPSISADGRYVAFSSEATNLVGGDTNAKLDIFVRDRQLGLTERVSQSSAGAEGNGHSTLPSINADGRYVAFVSGAFNLVTGDTNATQDIFVRDRQLGVTERVSVSSAGVEANGFSGQFLISISADGRYVAFSSSATNLVGGDTNGSIDIFVRDRQLGLTERISVSSAGLQGDADSTYVSISVDGRYVAFSSFASNLVGGDTNGSDDIFVRDRQLGLTERVSLGAAAAQGNGNSDVPSISADGRYVAFSSVAQNLVIGDANGTGDVFVRDRQLGTTERVSVHSSGVEGNGTCAFPSITTDGRYVAFQSFATNLVTGDTNGTGDAFVRDRQLGVTERVSVSSAGAEGNDLCFISAIAADGRCVAFESRASNLVAGDTNGSRDVFVRDRVGGPGFTSLCDPGTGGVIACPCSNPPAGSGRGCDNSSSTGGAVLSAGGGSGLSSDTLVFTTSGQKPTASVLVQGTAVIATGAIYGQGIRCVGGTLYRLFTKGATGSGITVPDLGAGDPPVSVRSAALGDTIQAGQSRWYLVLYRDGIVLGGCPASSYFNTTQTGRVTWGP